MTAQTEQNKPVFAGKHDENILVVRRDALFPQGAWTGLKSFSDIEWVEKIMEKKEFHPRSLMETDPTFKQIIPYLVFTANGKWFIMQRKAKASETRLQSKWSLGIGGHIREEDMENASLLAWAQREFEEEVAYSGNWTCKPVGILNDDSNDVGKVHAGFVYVVEGDSEDIAVRDEHQSGQLWSLEECEAKYDSMETWSQIVFDWIKQQ